MKTSAQGHRARARFARFISAPPSVMKAMRSLRNASAQALFSFLVEKCFSFGQGYADLSYAQLAEAIGRSTRTVATMAKRLRVQGLLLTEQLLDGSYRWKIPVLAEEVKEDPLGVLAIRAIDSEPISDPIPIPIGYDQTIMGGHDRLIMGGMIKRSYPMGMGMPLENLAFSTVSACSEPEITEPKRHDQETSLKRHHHETVCVTDEVAGEERGVDESLNHKKLLRKLLELGMKQRVARKLLRENEHQVVSGALKRVALRGDIANPAGYVLREVEDGGYEESLDLCFEDLAERRPRDPRESAPIAKDSDAPIVSLSAEQTRAQAQALQVEREAQAALSWSQVQTLLARFSELSGELKEALRARWTAAKEQMVPNTPRKAEILRDPRFEKMAFREVTTKFFALLDDGATQAGALAGLG